MLQLERGALKSEAGDTKYKDKDKEEEGTGTGAKDQHQQNRSLLRFAVMDISHLRRVTCHIIVEIFHQTFSLDLRTWHSAAAVSIAYTFYKAKAKYSYSYGSHTREVQVPLSLSVGDISK